MTSPSGDMLSMEVKSERGGWEEDGLAQLGRSLCSEAVGRRSNRQSRCSRRHFAQGGLSPTAHLTFRKRQESQATYVRLNRGARSDTGSIVGLFLVSPLLRGL